MLPRIAFPFLISLSDAGPITSDHELKVSFGHFLKWGASSQWSFGPNSAWGSIEMTTIGKTHPTLPSLGHFTSKNIKFCSSFLNVRVVMINSVNERSPKVILDFTTFGQECHSESKSQTGKMPFIDLNNLILTHPKASGRDS